MAIKYHNIFDKKSIKLLFKKQKTKKKQETKKKQTTKLPEMNERMILTKSNKYFFTQLYNYY